MSEDITIERQICEKHLEQYGNTLDHCPDCNKPTPIREEFIVKSEDPLLSAILIINETLERREFSTDARLKILELMKTYYLIDPPERPDNSHWETERSSDATDS